MIPPIQRTAPSDYVNRRFKFTHLSTSIALESTFVFRGNLRSEFPNVSYSKQPEHCGRPGNNHERDQAPCDASRPSRNLAIGQAGQRTSPPKSRQSPASSRHRPRQALQCRHLFAKRRPHDESSVPYLGVRILAPRWNARRQSLGPCKFYKAVYQALCRSVSFVSSAKSAKNNDLGYAWDMRGAFSGRFQARHTPLE